MLSINSVAPDFTLPDKDGVNHSLSEFRGKKVVLYFYPKDNTGGCTTQGLQFKELNDEFKALNAVIIGISKDSPASHAKFIEKYDFPFILLSDVNKDVINTYGVWQEKVMYGKKTFGVVRTTYVIDENGVIISAETKVKASENAVCTLNFLKNQ